MLALLKDKGSFGKFRVRRLALYELLRGKHLGYGILLPILCLELDNEAEDLGDCVWVVNCRFEVPGMIFLGSL